MIDNECLTKLQNFYANNKSTFGDDLESLDAITHGILCKSFPRSMDHFDDAMHDVLPSTIAYLVANGHDISAANYNGQREELITPGFNTKRRYFYFNDKGRLTSTDTKDCDGFLTEKNLSYIVELASYRGTFYENLSDGAKEIINNYI